MNTSRHNKKEQAKTCSIHKLNTMKKQIKIECSSLKSVMNTRNGGQGWIRTTEVVDGRFTVCSLWPLGNLPILSLQKNGAGGRTRTPDLLITNQLLYQLSYTSVSTLGYNTITKLNSQVFFESFFNFFDKIFIVLILTISYIRIIIVYYGGD